MRRGGLLIVALLAVALPVQAQPLAVEAAATQLTGNGNLTAGLLHYQARDNGLLPAPGFTIVADHLAVETDQALAAVSYQGSNPNALQPTTEHRDYQQAMVRGIEVRPGYRVVLDPLNGGATLTWTLDCLDVTPASGTAPTQAMVQHEANRPTRETNLSKGLTVANCGSDAILVVEGDFRVVLWQWDARLTSNSSSADLPSGHEEQPVGPLTIGAVREQYLIVTNGRLEFTPPAAGELHVSQAVATNFTHATFREAVVNGERAGYVHAQGDLTGTFDGRQGSVVADLRGATAYQANGRQSPVSPRVSWEWLPTVATVGLVVTGALTLAVWPSAAECRERAFRLHATGANRLALLYSFLGGSSSSGQSELRGRIWSALGARRLARAWFTRALAQPHSALDEQALRAALKE